jgi:hydrogenase nickel incorporation protein HypA/HybF
LIEEVPVEIFCSGCKAARPLSSIQWFACPQCGTPSAEVVRGKELEVTALEVQE